MATPLKYRTFRKLFSKFGVELTLRATHLHMTRSVNDKTYQHIAVVKRDEVDGIYVSKARKALQLAPDHGVSDEQFFAKK